MLASYANYSNVRHEPKKDKLFGQDVPNRSVFGSLVGNLQRRIPIWAGRHIRVKFLSLFNILSPFYSAKIAGEIFCGRRITLELGLVV